MKLARLVLAIPLVLLLGANSQCVIETDEDDDDDKPKKEQQKEAEGDETG
jgi:hypothetical protein